MIHSCTRDYLVWSFLDFFHGIRAHPHGNRYTVMTTPLICANHFIFVLYLRFTTMVGRLWVFSFDLYLIFWLWSVVITICGWCLIFCCCGTVTGRFLLDRLTEYPMFLVRRSHLLLCALELIYFGLQSLIYFVLIWLFQGLCLICCIVGNL